MPEGDTIYRAARTLEKALGGKVVTGFETGLAKLARVNDDTPVVGRTVDRVEARGKWLLIFFSGDLILVTHMLMSGSWHVYRVGERWRQPRRATRVVVRVADPTRAEARQVYPEKIHLRKRNTGFLRSAQDDDEKRRVQQRWFCSNKLGTQMDPTHAMKPHEWGIHNESSTQGGVEFEAVLFNAQVAEFHTARSLERSAQVPRLGPDVLSGEFTVERGVAAMRAYAAAHPEAEVAVVLLNQRVLAGLGNVYKSEVAFAAGVNPFRQMRTVSEREMERMVEFAQRYMRANVVEGSSEGIVTHSGPRRTTRAMEHGDRLWVYGRQGQECRRCGAAVMMRKQGLAVRSTYWCPVCQPWVAGEGQSEVAPVGKAERLVKMARKIGCEGAGNADSLQE